MLIIRKNQTNDLVVTVSMNKTLPSPFYLFSFQHITSKERVSFIGETITTNSRYDKFRFVEGTTTNLSLTPPQVNFEYLGQYYYSVYEQLGSGNTNPALAYNKLEEGRAIVLIGEGQTDVCFYEPYISNNEDFANIVYVSEQELECEAPDPTQTMTPSPSSTPVTPTPTPTNTGTPTQTPTGTPTQTPTQTGTPTPTPTPTCAVTTQYLKVELQDNTKFKLSIWNDSGFTSPANAICDYQISGTAYGDLGTIYDGVETILQGQHQKQFDLAPILQAGEIINNFAVISYQVNGCVCPLNLILPCNNIPYEVILSSISGGTQFNGTYSKINSFTGGTLGYGYINLSGGTYQMKSNTILGGKKYAIYGRVVSGEYQTLIAYAINDIYLTYVIVRSTGNYIFNGGILISGLPVIGDETEFYGNFTSLKPGTVTYLSSAFNVEYPDLCVLSFSVTSGSTKANACASTTSFNVYALVQGDCSSCFSASLNCWACVSTFQQVYLDSALTTLVPNGYYTNDMDGSGNYGTWNIIGGFPQGAGFSSGCP